MEQLVAGYRRGLTGPAADLAGVRAMLALAEAPSDRGYWLGRVASALVALRLGPVACVVTLADSEGAVMTEPALQ